jgi:hypothetical protein
MTSKIVPRVVACPMPGPYSGSGVIYDTVLYCRDHYESWVDVDALMSRPRRTHVVGERGQTQKRGRDGGVAVPEGDRMGMEITAHPVCVVGR